MGNTSRDQYSGVFYGLAVTYDLVTDQGVRNWVSYLATRVLGYLSGNFWNVVLPVGSIGTTFLIRPDQQLALLLVGRHVNGGQFGTKYSAESNALSPTVPIPVGIDCTDGTGSYFKFNLDYINLYTLRRLGSGYSSFWYGLANDELRSTTDGHGNAFFNMIDRVANGANSKRGWRGRARMCIAISAGSFRRAERTKRASRCVENRVTTAFLWQRDPFQLSGGGNGDIETAGIDYLPPYWMERFYAVITE